MLDDNSDNNMHNLAMGSIGNLQKTQDDVTCIYERIWLHMYKNTRQCTCVIFDKKVYYMCKSPPLVFVKYLLITIIFNLKAKIIVTLKKVC